MPLFRPTESQHTHHHGLLAGVSAGAMGVLAVFGFVALDWHRVSGTIGAAMRVIVWTATFAAVGLVLAAAIYVALWLRHRVRYPETLGVRQPTVRAEVPAGTPAAAVTAQHPAAELPAGGTHTHYHFDTAEAVEAMRRGYPPTVIATDAEEIQP